jgi:protein tyrosine phosphatase (PTP) superfamily phosphohydrolase (DUF442 family)
MVSFIVLPRGIRCRRETSPCRLPEERRLPETQGGLIALVVSSALQRRCVMQRRTPRLVLLTVAGCLMAAAASAQVVRQDVPGIRNFAKVETTVACAGAITPGAIPEIKKMGYASIINLRLPTEEGANVDENIAAAKAAGIPYYHIPFSGAMPDPAVVDTFLKTITAPGVQPAFIH